MNAFHLAATSGKVRSLRYLAPHMGEGQYDFDLKAQNSLHYAVVHGHLKVVRYLIDKCGFDPRLPDLVGIHTYVHTYICTVHTCVYELWKGSHDSVPRGGRVMYVGHSACVSQRVRCHPVSL